MATPHLIVMVGIPGSGKSFFAQKFADTFNAPYVSFDTIHRIAGEPELTEKFMETLLQELFKTKQAIVYEGSGATRTERDELAKKAKAAGYQALFVWVQTDPDSAVTRARKAGWTDEELNAHDERFSPPHEKEKPIVISGKHTFGTQLKIVLKRLSGPRTEEIALVRPITPQRILSDFRRSR